MQLASLFSVFPTIMNISAMYVITGVAPITVCGNLELNIMVSMLLYKSRPFASLMGVGTISLMQSVTMIIKTNQTNKKQTETKY